MTTNKKTSAFERLRAKVTPQHREFVALNLDIVEQIHALLQKKGWTQKELAKAMGKNESEISRLLSGTQNITTQTFANLKVAFGEAVIATPLKMQPIKEAKVVSLITHGETDDYIFEDIDLTLVGVAS